jgi:hypothetical protein
MPDEFLKEGLRVRVKYVPSKCGFSICMVGRVVDIVAIENLEE